MKDLRSWNDYYLNNDNAISLIKTYNESNGLDKAKILQNLVKKLSYLVYSKTNSYKNKKYYDDITQEGMIGLINAINKFDYLRGPNFFIIAEWNIIENIRRYLKWNSKHESKKNVQYKKYFRNKSYNIVEDLEYRNSVNVNFSKLSYQSKYVLVERFKYNNTLLQIARELGICKERVRQIENSILTKIKSYN